MSTGTCFTAGAACKPLPKSIRRYRNRPLSSKCCCILPKTSENVSSSAIVDLFGRTQSQDVLPFEATDVQDDSTWLERSELVLGKENIATLSRSHVVIVGLGGVGSWSCEFLARSGVGHLTIIDGDHVASSNRNRQLPALKSTIGISKAQVCVSVEFTRARFTRGPSRPDIPNSFAH